MATTVEYRDGGVYRPFNADVTPIGTILAYGGSTAPPGWAICDGTLGTPDLRNRFIVAAGASYAVGNTGGASAVTLTAAESGLVSHAHTATAAATTTGHYHGWSTMSNPGNHLHSTGKRANAIRHTNLSDTGNVDWVARQLEPAEGTEPNGGRTTTAANHTHGGTSGNQTANHYHGITVDANAVNAAASHDNMPPYFALVYIQRKS